MMRALKSVSFVVICAALGGCASGLVGYDAETSHTCPRAEGLGCTPVSEVYKRAIAGSLPGQSRQFASAQATTEGGGLNALSGASARQVMSTGMPIRTAPRVLRIWFAPWKDALDVLHDQRHSYLTLDNGRWLIEHNQQRLFQEFAATRLVQGLASGDPKQSATTSPSPSTTAPARALQLPALPSTPSTGAR